MSRPGTSALLPLQSRTVAVSWSKAAAAVKVIAARGASLTVLMFTSPSRVPVLDSTISPGLQLAASQYHAPRYESSCPRMFWRSAAQPRVAAIASPSTAERNRSDACMPRCYGLVRAAAMLAAAMPRTTQQSVLSAAMCLALFACHDEHKDEAREVLEQGVESAKQGYEQGVESAKQGYEQGVESA